MLERVDPNIFQLEVNGKNHGSNRINDAKYVFKTEDEMINYFIENTGLNQTFYWNKNHNNPDKIMVGAILTEDDKLIMSLTIDGTQETEKRCFEKLKNILRSNIGVISYINPADYDNRQDFITKYGQNSSYPKVVVQCSSAFSFSVSFEWRVSFKD